MGKLSHEILSRFISYYVYNLGQILRILIYILCLWYFRLFEIKLTLSNQFLINDL